MGNKLWIELIKSQNEIIPKSSIIIYSNIKAYDHIGISGTLSNLNYVSMKSECVTISIFEFWFIYNFIQ